MTHILDRVYRERSQIIAALSKVFPAWIASVDDPEPNFNSAVYISLPTGQVSWHIRDDERDEFFTHLARQEEYGWDGHDTEEKYRRLNELQSLDSLLTEHNITNIDCHKVHFEICDEFYGCIDQSFWRAFLSRDSIISAERYWVGEGNTYEEAIRDAIKHQGPLTTSRLSAWDSDERDM